MLEANLRHPQRPIHLRHKRRMTPKESWNEAKQNKRNNKAKNNIDRAHKLYSSGWK